MERPISQTKPGFLPRETAESRATTAGGQVPDQAWTRTFALLALLILAMVLLGGLVRLTGSGLSITEWQPISGILPPLNEPAWQTAFEKYRNSPQYLLENSHFSFAEFRFIYLMEYGHRLLGRLLALAVILPGLHYLRRYGRDPRILKRGALLLSLGLVQGLAGWLMVKSGLQELPRVDPFRLAIHLLLALATFSYCCWMLFHHRFPSRPQGSSPARILPLTLLFAFLLLLQILFGALLAGGKAGHLYPQYPLMAGELLPRAAWQLNPLWLNPLHNPVMIHFLHRHLPLLLLLLASALSFTLTRSRHPDPLRARTGFALLALLLLQFCLGVVALLFHVPTLLASLHQCNAFLLWAACLLLLQRLMPTHGPPLARSRQP